MIQKIFVRLYEKVTMPKCYKESSINIADFCKSSIGDSTKTLSHFLKNKTDFSDYNNYIEYQVSVISEALYLRLNEIHRTHYSYEFWSFILNAWLVFLLVDFMKTIFYFKNLIASIKIYRQLLF